MPQRDPVTFETPASLMEEREDAAVADRAEGLLDEAAQQLIAQEERQRRILAWITEADSLVGIGLRARIAAIKLRVDELDGTTLEDLASQCGYRRTAVCNIGQDFSANFGARGLHDRTDEMRAQRRRATLFALSERVVVHRG
jgi:hypothetical protein